MARPVSESPPGPEPARIRAPTRQAALTGPPAEAPATSPFRTVCRPPSDDHQPPWTHPADSSVCAASSRARTCSRQACWTSSGGGATRAGRRRHQGRWWCAGPPPVSALVAGLLTATGPVSGAGPERKIVAISPASPQRAPERQRRRQSVDRCDFWDNSQFDRFRHKGHRLTLPDRRHRHEASKDNGVGGGVADDRLRSGGVFESRHGDQFADQRSVRAAYHRGDDHPRAGIRPILVPGGKGRTDGGVAVQRQSRVSVAEYHQSTGAGDDDHAGSGEEAGCHGGDHSQPSGAGEPRPAGHVRWHTRRGGQCR